ncbi:MAG: acyl-CoA dehydrogenase [Alphaproteobacteria bacterium]|nr:acyl-CoA dehydrogenase [Alphaproteobacteria bacterium]
MTETTTLLQDAAHRLFAEHVTPDVLKAAEQGIWPDRLWSAIDDAGFLDVLADSETPIEERLAHASVLLKVAGRHLVPVPVGETAIVRMLLAEREIDFPQGPLSFGLVRGHTHVHGDHSHVEGKAVRVPYAGHSKALLLATPDGTDGVLLATRRLKWNDGKNIAAEPRDDLVLSDTAGTTVRGVSGELLEAAGAVLRSMQIAGALERVLLQTVDYARTRVQFGKPIAAFQAIQQQLAVLAGQTAAASMAAESAIAELASPSRRRAAAVAKVRCGEAAGIAASIAHQVHGAIGITYEHSLHFATRRLWSWRAEFGSEAIWSEQIGRAAAGAGADAYWPTIAGAT